MTYDNTNSGILARNERRTTDSHPDFTGSLNVNGVDYWVSAWVNEGRAGSKMEGKKYFSLKVNPKESRGPAPRTTTPRANPDQFVSDDIPF
jgi:hypothetical protein